MDMDYIAANPTEGYESALLKFREDESEAFHCYLIDAGQGTNVDELLDRGDIFSGILLTHAHLDHVIGLWDNYKEGIPIYTTPDTAAIIGTLLESGNRFYSDGSQSMRGRVGPEFLTTDKYAERWDVEELVNAIQPITDWIEPSPGVSIRPIPAGHTPGACSYFIKQSDGDTSVNTLVTGDFTFGDVAGNPGLPELLPFDLDILFLNNTTVTLEDGTQSHLPGLTDGVGQIIESAQTNRHTLVTASGLSAVHISGLLSTIAEEKGLRYKIGMVGLAGKLYESLDLDYNNVTPVPTFSGTEEVTDEFEVVITTPETPTAGAGKRLFGAIRDKPGSAVIQFTNKNSRIEGKSRQATIYTYEYNIHPQRDSITEFIEEANPYHLIPMHDQIESYKNSFDHLYVWSDRSSIDHTLVSDNTLMPPPWIQSSTISRIEKSRREIQRFESLFDTDQPFDIDPLEHYSHINLENELVDITTIANQSSISQDRGTKEPRASQSSATHSRRQSTPQGGSQSKETQKSTTSEDTISATEEPEKALENPSGEQKALQESDGSTESQTERSDPSTEAKAEAEAEADQDSMLEDRTGQFDPVSGIQSALNEIRSSAVYADVVEDNNGSLSISIRGDADIESGDEVVLFKSDE